MVRGYTPEVQGLPESPVSEQRPEALEEQAPRLALQKLNDSGSLVTMKPEQLPEERNVYFVKRDKTFGT